MIKPFGDSAHNLSHSIYERNLLKCSPHVLFLTGKTVTLWLPMKSGNTTIRE